MAMSRKEMGLAVRALEQYADDCLGGTGDYIEMISALNVAKNLASMYELREEKWINDIYHIYVADAMDTLRETMKKGKEAKDIFDELEELADL